MKNSLFIFGIVLLLLPVLGSAQIVYIDTTGVSALKKTTTIFVIPKASNSLKAEYEQAIRSSWKITPYKIVTVDELAQYAGKERYSFFCELCFGEKVVEIQFDGTITTPVSPVPYNGKKDTVTHSFGGRQTEEARILGAAHGKGGYSYYSLFIKQEDNDGTTRTARYAGIKIGAAKGRELNTPNGNAKETWSEGHNLGSPYWNPYWNPGLFKAYLQIVNDELSGAPGAGTTALLPFRNSEDATAMRSLTNDTLYIPEYIEWRISSGLFKEWHNYITNDAFEKDYPYPHRLVSSEQLSDLLLRSAAPVNFLTYNAYDPVLLITKATNGQQFLIRCMAEKRYGISATK